MLGAIIGDIIGSIYEFHNIKTKTFQLFGKNCFFTDDTVMTVAVAEGLMNGGRPSDYIEAMKLFGRMYPQAGYGGKFSRWLFGDDNRAYGSWGNGSAMRVSPIGWWFDSLEQTENAAEVSAAVTHNHQEGIKGAQATAAAIFLARNGKSKEEIKFYVESRFGYDLSRTLDEMRQAYGFDESCMGTVPEAIIAFLESNDFEDAIRGAISLGGDSDTLAAITGSIAEAAYGVPEVIQENAIARLDEPLLEVFKRWQKTLKKQTMSCGQNNHIVSQETKILPHTPSDFNHVEWLKKFSVASMRHEGFRELRAEIFLDTIRAVRNGGYSVDGTYINLDNAGVTENTEFFDSPIALGETDNVKRHQTKFTVIGADCLETAHLLLSAGLHPCVLNMASRQNPGGGVLGGAGAQEENLFRRSNLFLSMYQFVDFADQYGLPRNSNSYPLDRNFGGVYSPNITVFRASEANGYFMLRKPYKISVVSVAAINHPDLTDKNGTLRIIESLVEPTKEKIRTILRISGKHHHDCLVLSAFGCGAFANPPEHMAELFFEVLQEPEFQNCFLSIVFAVLADHNSKGKYHNPNGNLLPFAEMFC